MFNEIVDTLNMSGHWSEVSMNRLDKIFCGTDMCIVPYLLLLLLFIALLSIGSYGNHYIQRTHHR